MGRNLLFCKGCEHLCRFSKLQGENIVKCDIDNHLKADTDFKGGMWAQYSNVCPLKKYIGKADFGMNPVIFDGDIK